MDDWMSSLLKPELQSEYVMELPIELMNILDNGIVLDKEGLVKIVIKEEN
jgi:hypothetical protein